MISKIWGSLQLKNELDPTTVSRDPAVVQAYISDRLNHNKATPGFYFEMVGAIQDTVKRRSGFAYPLQMLIAFHDLIVDQEASRRFFETLELPDKAMTQYPDYYHEIFNEPGKEKPFEELKKWILSHSALS